MSAADRAKTAVRAVIAAPGIRHGLRWFIRQAAVPSRLRDLAHRKLAKRARFADGSWFDYTTETGARLRFLHHGTPNYLYWLDEYEPETTSLFRVLARSAEVVLDIGAADGIYSILAAAENPAARILAFEPGRDAATTCARNFELNEGITRRVELHQLALGSEDAEVILYVAGATGGTSSLNPEFRANRVEERVAVRRGDSALVGMGVARVDLIKIDTESTEPAVLGGLCETLDRDHPDVICEVLRGRTEVALHALLQPLGYSYFHVTARGLIPRTALAGDETYRAPNFLFTTRTARELEQLGVQILPA